jgi:hypothetical protein
MGFANSEDWMTGQMYIFNNTLSQPKDEGANGLGGESRIIKHCVSRNNILHVRSGDTHSISTEKRSVDNDFDYDLLSAARYPADQEKHGIKGTPRYVPGAGFLRRLQRRAGHGGSRSRHPADGLRSQGRVHSAGRVCKKSRGPLDSPFRTILLTREQPSGQRVPECWPRAVKAWITKMKELANDEVLQIMDPVMSEIRSLKS